MSRDHPYADRAEAGRVLARCLPADLLRSRPLILAVSRGGVVVAAELAHTIGAPLEPFLVRKLPAPHQPELAIGAITAGNYEVLNEEAVAELGLTPFEIARIADRERTQLAQQEALHRQGRPPATIRGRSVVLVDDGAATGCTMRVALAAVRDQGATRVAIALPVTTTAVCAALTELADDVVCPLQPNPFHLVTLWYDEFPAVTDQEVSLCLAAHQQSA